MIKIGQPLFSCITTFLTHYTKLIDDVYPQPSDDGHTAWTMQAIAKLLPEGLSNVLDVGCGDGFCKYLFEIRGILWTGLTLNKKECDKEFTFHLDMAATSFEDATFDLIFARHVLEHSPFPLIALMEWYRISKKYCIVINPAPEYWGYGGQNHYHVMLPEQLKVLFARSGWKIVKEDTFTTADPIFQAFYMVGKKPEDRVWQGEHKDVEYRYLLEKVVDEHE